MLGPIAKKRHAPTRYVQGPWKPDGKVENSSQNNDPGRTTGTTCRTFRCCNEMESQQRCALARSKSCSWITQKPLHSLLFDLEFVPHKDHNLHPKIPAASQLILVLRKQGWLCFETLPLTDVEHKLVGLRACLQWVGGHQLPMVKHTLGESLPRCCSTQR